jgi:hypothetical protein
MHQSIIHVKVMVLESKKVIVKVSYKIYEARAGAGAERNICGSAELE